MSLNEKEKNKTENQLHKNLNFTFISNITNNSYTVRDLDNSFIIFNTINNLLYLVYSTEIKSIISYDLNKFQIITEIKNPHEGHYITNFRYFFDRNNNNDLILSISAKNCMIKIWNNKNWDCILNIKDIYQNGITNSACFISYDKDIFIVTSNNFWLKPDFIKVYDLKGNIIKIINDSEENTYYIDTYSDQFNSNLYIISCNYDCVISYNYIKNEKYCKYFDSNSKYHCSFKILEKDKILKLIESAADGIIRIWNFHSGSLIKKIYISNVSLYGIYLWEYDFIFVGCADNNIKLININNGEILKNIEGFKNWVCTICGISHIKYGSCLIAQSIKDEQIKLFQIKNDK